MSTKNGVRRSKVLPLAGVLALTVLAGTIFASQSLAASASQHQQSDQGDDRPSWVFKLNNRYSDHQDGTLNVRAGAGGAVAPLTWFFPKNAEIKVGETVVWRNPTAVSEPHSVTFIKDPAAFPPLDVPYVISNSSALVPLDPSTNADPTLIPGPDGQTVALIANARAYSPVAVTNGEAKFLPFNANYTISGDESYVNSGLIWPENQVPPGLPEITSFSVKFEKAGTYDYLCILHPWMAGRVVVGE